MNNHWTFTEVNNVEWVHETFYSKVDAISEGKKIFQGKDIVVGQLKIHEGNYSVENQEIIKVN